MLKGDIKRHMYEKMGITTVEGANQNMLTGQTISKEEIYSFTSYKMMNDDERKIVNTILSSFKTSTQDIKTERGKTLLKQMDSLVPRSESSSDAVDFKDVA